MNRAEFRERIRTSLANPTLQIALDANAERRVNGRASALASLPDWRERRQQAHLAQVTLKCPTRSVCTDRAKCTSFSSTGLRVRLLTIEDWNDTISPARFDCVVLSASNKRPHRLAAQDGALSRLKQGFESPWGHPFPRDRQQIMLSGFCLC